MDWNEIPHDQYHIGDPSDASKMISEHMVRSAQTVHLSCVNISTISKQTKTSIHLASSPRSTIGCVQNDFCAYDTFGTKCAPILHWQFHCLQMDWNMIPHDQCHLGDPSGASKMIFEPIVRLAQTVHLSCLKVSTISKQTKTSIHLGLVTLEYHRVRPKRFLSVDWWKSCTYVALTLTLSPNGLKRDSKWPMSPRRSIGCVQNDFWAYGTFSANHVPILYHD
jgi:hypothetical protein